MAGLYIHVPFCKQACYYCDFHFTTRMEDKPRMVRALVRELALYAAWLQDHELDSVYFGGGTPSRLAPDEAEQLLSAIHTWGCVRPGAEITFEVNPDDITPAYLQALRELGINRLSIGIQSFHAPTLRAVNRAHTAEEALASVDMARAAGFDNLNVDLIFGLPEQTLALWQADLAQALTLAPAHLSLYGLTLEPGTVLERAHSKGKITLPDEDMQADAYLLMGEELERHGYLHYEISNACRPGHHSRHNTAYWQKKPFLGIGPSAHSYDGLSRWYNVRHNTRYMEGIETDKPHVSRHTLAPHDHINEHIMLGLRTQWGCDLRWLREQHGHDVLQLHAQRIQDHLEGGRMRLDRAQERLYLTTQGRLLANRITQDFFVEAHAAPADASAGDETRAGFAG